MNANHNVFLSFARNDASHADKLRRLLCARSDVRLVSSDDFGAGESWQTKLRESVAKSDWFILILSPESLNSSWLLKELGAAWALEKPILVVVAGTTVPMKLPVELEQKQFARIGEFKKPEDFDRWFEHMGNAVAA